MKGKIVKLEVKEVAGFKVTEVVVRLPFLIEEGYPSVAKVIGKHRVDFILDEDKKPNTWEEKIVYYADKRVKYSEPISLEERFENWKKKHSDIDVLKKKVLPKILEIENEIMGVIDV